MATSRSRRRLSPEARRGELIDAAIRLLDSGQEVTNWVQAVTSEADAAKGTFYVYFSSWDDMLAAVRERVLRGYVDRFHELAEATGPIDWWAVLDAEFAAALDSIAKPGGLHAAVFHTGGRHTVAPAPAPADVDMGQDIIPAMAKALRRGMDDGALRQVDPRIAATVLFTVLHGAADAIAAGQRPEPWLESVRDLARRWLTP
ncbi:TetR/AcrR family transcriptional regulator [Spongiactinospora sp. 9N601]|uniref:TetR/AcrR family transcriptional regulator n=1 Tax=Spongiactinospora sp. 9N601 TaxID=3375149 RepID=UPI00378E30DA